ncbi:MAG: GDP-L-fucose synthase, partial [Rhizobiaceae bacterium]
MNPTNSKIQLEGKRVYVAGHNGLVGSALMRRLEGEGCDLLTASRVDLDLRQQASVETWMQKHRPQIIFMAAAKVGGIQANIDSPVEFLYDNLMIETNIIHAAHRAKVEKLVNLGSTCIYPKLAPQPLREEYLLTGALEPTNEGYAIAKIAGIKLCEAYGRQHDCNFISVLPTNLYGVGDNFDLTTSHVLPALMRKAHEAKQAKAKQLVVWGSGTPTREFLHVDDLAEALVFVAKQYHDRLPL